MLQEAADEGATGQANHPFAAAVIGAYPQQHVLIADCYDAFIGNGRAVGVARQVFKHLGGPAQRAFGIDDPVVC